jgi:hypothetical protein
MLLTTIIMAAVALIAGYAGARWQRSRQTGITKLEAKILRVQISKAQQMAAYAIGLYEEHADAHKVVNHHLDVLSHNMSVAGRVIGLEQSREFRSIN